MRHLRLLLAGALVTGFAGTGCHYHDYRDYQYHGDLSRDTHGVMIYQTAEGEVVESEPVPAGTEEMEVY